MSGLATGPSITPHEAKQLPIRKHAEEIVEAVKTNPTVIVLGETGSGKTTQISQILLEAGFAAEGQIAITQPRRVAAVTVAKRVAEELGVQLGKEVGYSVRFEDCTCPDTKIKYLTDGTLLRECLDDAQLSKYSVIVLDEAHERSLSTDILFGIIKRLVKERTKPLKLVVTSATLDGEKFSAYFDSCPVFSVPGRCYPVDVIHTREDHTTDYVDAAVDTVLQIHTQQGPGDILVFLTGQAEIEKCIKQLNEAIASLPDGSCGPLLLLPLYASLPPEMQVRVFRPPPEGTRRCIVATNVAETSVTVDGVVYVIDSGMVKLKSYVPNTGMDSLDVVPASRVGATQRAGRAGRTRPGKCFRLYTRQFFDREMPNVTPPEIQRTSLAGTVLYLKSLALAIDVLTFDFLDPPSRESLEDALRTLYLLDALDDSGNLTDTGRAMAVLPLEPGLARCLLAAVELRCLPEALSVAAMLSNEHIFEHGRSPADARPDAAAAGGRNERGNRAGPTQKLKALMSEGYGDHILMLRLWDLWAQAKYDKRALQDLGLDLRGMNFVKDVRRQLEGILSSHLTSTSRKNRHEARDDDRSRRRSRSPAGADGAGGDGERRRDREESERSGRGARSRSRSRSPPARKDAARGAAGVGGSQGADAMKPFHFPTEHARVSSVIKAITIGFAHKLARRLPRHNGYRTLGTGVQVGGGQLAQLHPMCSGLQEDEDGLLPEWVVYHELVSTSRPFLRQVVSTHYSYVEPLLNRIAKIDVQRLSRGPHALPPTAAATDAAAVPAAAAAGATAAAASKPAAKKDDVAVNAARQRYLERKKQAGKG